jgi:hypothetical protein
MKLTESAKEEAPRDAVGVRFGLIKRGERFLYKNHEWVRTRGTFAMRIQDIGTGASGWPFKLATIVLPLKR